MPQYFSVDKRKEFVNLSWHCEDVTEPKYSAEFVVWSEPPTGTLIFLVLVRTCNTNQPAKNTCDRVDSFFFKCLDCLVQVIIPDLLLYLTL